jgi:virginiamycin B lyase
MVMESSIRSVLLRAALGITLGAAACSSGPDARPGAELTGTATAQLQIIPVGVRCVTIQVSNGTTSVAPAFDVSPQSVAEFTLKGLPLGADTFQATASPSACGGTGATVSFASSPVMATVASTTSPSVTLQMQAVSDAGGASVGVNFPAATSGVITYFPVSSSTNMAVGPITTGPDGNLWVALNGQTGPGGQLAKVTTAGVATMVPLPSGTSFISGITLGPDGNLWFTIEVNSSASPATPSYLAHIAPDGTGFSEQSFGGSTASQLVSITVGPDGALWVGDGLQNALLRVSTAGTLLQQFPIPTANAWPDSLAVGLDGNIWFTENVAGDGGFIKTATKVGVLNPSTGTFNELPVTGGATQIAAGANGDLYVSVQAPPGSTTGSILTIAPPGPPVATSVPPANAVAAGPDGNVWFLEQSAVCRITPQGMITQFPDSGFGTNLAAGPDGNVWFGQGNKIARITP